MNVGNIDRQSVHESVDDAINRPLDYDPSQRASFIREMLRDIPRAMSAGMSDADICTRFKEFSDFYPELMKKILARSELTPIHTMLAMLDRVGNGSLTTHQASVIVGQRLVDRYVTI